MTRWKERLTALRAEPTDERLQLACDLLDELDTAICRRWAQAGHAERLAELQMKRVELRKQLAEQPVAV